ncbi:hypothetical protein [Trueperella sp. LYQ143]|uniref:hypothetical protein n=1 Tax=unclassified Trueperella TaxID=2630174 RepID=UPI003982DEE8
MRNRKIIWVTVAAFLLAGCTDSASPDTPAQSQEHSASDNQGSDDAPANPSQTAPADPARHIASHPEADGTVYLAGDNAFEVKVPAQWAPISSPADQMPITVANPDHSQELSINYIGAERLLGDPAAYGEHLQANLGLSAGSVTYLDYRSAGEHKYPTFRVTTDTYQAYVYVVTVHGKVYEVTTWGRDSQNAVAATSLMDSFKTHE